MYPNGHRTETYLDMQSTLTVHVKALNTGFLKSYLEKDCLQIMGVGSFGCLHLKTEQ